VLIVGALWTWGCLESTPGYLADGGTGDAGSDGGQETGGGESDTGPTSTDGGSETAGNGSGTTASAADTSGEGPETTSDSGGTDSSGSGSGEGISLFDPSDGSDVPDDDPDSLAGVELGVRFYADVPGTITRLRFYKVDVDTGPHALHLWSATGVLLAAAQFDDAQASGWQEVVLDQPVAIDGGTEYVASYHTSSGFYSSTQWYFQDAGVDNPPLHAPQSQDMNGNGVYAYGPSSFPTETWRASNYYADVVFVP
jgi:hypothetical protein